MGGGLTRWTGPGASRRNRMLGTVQLGRMDRDKFLRQIADESGGRFIRIDDVSNMEHEFLQILEEIKSRYLLTYYPKGVVEEGWHRLEVKLKGHKGDVRARRGYKKW